MVLLNAFETIIGLFNSHHQDLRFDDELYRVILRDN